MGTGCWNLSRFTTKSPITTITPALHLVRYTPHHTTPRPPAPPPQVCNLAWSRNVNEIVSAHGYSQNQIIVWKYPSMAKLATLTGHTYRVLYLAVAPDGQTIVTGAGDETLRFWSVFPGPKAAAGGPGGAGGSSGSSLMRTTIR